jgi:Zn-dependent protease
MKKLRALAEKIPIRMSLPSLCFFLFLLWLEPSSYSALPLLAALWHECGHLIALLLTHRRLTCVRIYPFGVDIRTQGVGSYGDDLFVSAAGAMANLLACAFCAPHLEYLGVQVFFISNLTLALCNLCPVDTLDGGAILYALLCRKYLPDRAERILRRVSFFALIFLWVLATYLLFFSGAHFSFFVMILYLFACLFLHAPNKRIPKES